MVFWGLSTTAHIYLPDENQVAQYTALAMAAALAFVVPWFLSFPYCDTVAESGPAPGSRVRCPPGGYPWTAYFALVIIGSAPFAAGLAFLMFDHAVGNWMRGDAYWFLVLGTVGLMAVDVVAALLWSGLDDTRRIGFKTSATWLLVHSAVIAAFVAALPTT